MPPTNKGKESPTVDITLQIQEGKQYFVNRIIFTGNTTTRDNVIRRELRLYENGVFNTEALKYTGARAITRLLKGELPGGERGVAEIECRRVIADTAHS